MLVLKSRMKTLSGRLNGYMVINSRSSIRSYVFSYNMRTNKLRMAAMLKCEENNILFVEVVCFKVKEVKKSTVIHLICTVKMKESMVEIFLMEMVSV